jgi:hypothetical protein
MIANRDGRFCDKTTCEKAYWYWWERPVVTPQDPASFDFDKSVRFDIGMDLSEQAFPNGHYVLAAEYAMLLECYRQVQASPLPTDGGR